MRQPSLLTLTAILAILFLAFSPLAAQPPDAPPGTPTYAQARVLFDQAATDYENAVAGGATFTTLSQKYHTLCDSTKGIYWQCFKRGGKERIPFESNEFQVYLTTTAYCYIASGGQKTGLSGYGSSVLKISDLQGEYLSELQKRHKFISSLP